jgi:hypothetical protein
MIKSYIQATLNSKTMRRTSLFIFDYGIIFVFCFLFIILKGLYVSDWVVRNPLTFFNGAWVLAIGSAITCYLPFLFGIRVLKSPLWFFFFSWISLIYFFCESLILARNLTYSAGAPVFISGQITAYGIYYKMISPRLVLVLIATIYLIISLKPKYQKL